MISRPERSGNIGLLIGLALLLDRRSGGVCPYGSCCGPAIYTRPSGNSRGCRGVLPLSPGAIGFLKPVRRGLGEANPLASAFVDTLEDGALITDLDGRLVYANKSYADLTGAENAAEIRVVERVFSSDPEASGCDFPVVSGDAR